MSKLKVLFIGESWLGSCARSLKEALARRDDVSVVEINEEDWIPKPKDFVLRALSRVVSRAYRSRFAATIIERVGEFRPDVVMTYKGFPIRAALVEEIRACGAYTINVYPDCSPHAHGHEHRMAVGAFDLVISTKSFHPRLWKDTYGYQNRCVFVPQGYDPKLHLIADLPTLFMYDVVLVATYRAEYGRMMMDLGSALGKSDVSVAIGGAGWDRVRFKFPANWQFVGPVSGPEYVETLRRGRICIAPVTREVVVSGQPQPGDLDTTRTYELAAAHCFFVHQRTDFAGTLYDQSEVAMFSDGVELAAIIRHYLSQDAARAQMATAAHRRAVPSYSMDERAGRILALVREELAERCRKRLISNIELQKDRLCDDGKHQFAGKSR